MPTAPSRAQCGAALALLRGVALAGAPSIARGQSSPQGAQLERFEPTAAGSWLFTVEHPWYSSTRTVAAGLVFDYAHAPLLGGLYDANGRFVRQVAVVEHQLVGHLDVAVSLFDRVTLLGTLPVVLLETGTPAFGIDKASGASVGDPRLGALVRLWRDADRDSLSLHAGAYVWIPVGNQAALAGDPDARVEPVLIAAGVARDHVRWAVSTGLMVRATTQVGHGPASHVGSELHLRGGVGYGDAARRFHVGPEASLSVMVTGADAGRRETTSLELLPFAGQWNVARTVQLGLAVGSAWLPTLGSPDLRVIASFAWAPRPPVATKSVAPPDADHDGVPDASDLCPDTPGAAAASGCPKPPKPVDPDGDGVPEGEDLCPGESSGAHPDPHRKGCPQPIDPDGDGVPEGEDLCPGESSGAHPDPARKGCPAPDADGDGVPDAVDACPHLAGVASSDPAKSGCPATLEKGSRTTLRAVHFATNEATLVDDSRATLDEVARLLAAHAELRHVVIEGHADETGTRDWNQRLSRKRAEAVVRYLVEHGVAASRLKAVGYGDTRPASTDRSDEGRARNRRVEMLVPEK